MSIHAIMGRLANSPVMIAPGMGEWTMECLRGMASVERAGELMVDNVLMSDDFWLDSDDWRAAFRPYRVNAGVLTVPIQGMMLHDFGWQVGSWATGYTYIRKAVERGIADPDVHTIALVVNSGGGEVAGNFDLVDFIYEARSQKRIEAVVNEHAYSAAFSIASAAHQISLPRTGGVGSVGVLTSHVSYAKNLEKAGIEVTLIHAGENKVDGNPYEALPESVKNRMQARIDGLYNVFTATVARNLAISEEVVRGTEALTYSATEALEIGFAHSVKSMDETMAALHDGGATKIETEEHYMSTKPEDVAARAAEVEAARAEGVKAGAQAERTRIQGILGAAEAEGRGTLANHLAMSTDMSVEAAIAILAASPAEQKPQADAPKKEEKADNAFVVAMNNTPNPEVGANAGQPKVELSAADQILADYQAAVGQRKH